MSCTSPPAQTPVETTGDMLNAFQQFAPRFLETLNAQIQPNASANLSAAQATDPAYAKLNSELYSQYGPGLNKTASDIAAQNEMAQSQADLNVLNGPGGQAVGKVQQLDQGLNPEFYSQRAAGAGDLNKLFGSMTLGPGLSPSESIETQRSLARDNASRGLAPGVGSNSDVVSNAMQFGAAGENRQLARQDAFGKALGQLNSFLPTSKSNIDPFQVATGKPSQAQAPGVNTTPSNLGNQAFGFGQNLQSGINTLTNSQLVANADRATGGTLVNHAASSV